MKTRGDVYNDVTFVTYDTFIFIKYLICNVVWENINVTK